jgi:predicted TIM-barrel enzyme
MAKVILPAVKHAPCIAGIGVHDPAIDIDKLVDDMLELGFSGVTNEPFVGIYGEDFAAQLESAGIGFSREMELIKRASKRDIFTVAWAFNPEEAHALAEAGADILGAHVGVTAGGSKKGTSSADLAKNSHVIQSMCESAVK